MSSNTSWVSNTATTVPKQSMIDQQLSHSSRQSTLRPVELGEYTGV